MLKLYLASSSIGRQNLLKESKIEFQILQQNSKEDISREGLSLKEIVTNIAIHKMESTLFPLGKKDGEQILVLTADTMGIDGNGKICGKPISKDNAIEMIKSYRNGAVTGTAFCLDKKEFRNSSWQTVKRIIDYAQAEYIFDIPDNLIEWYLEKGLNINYMSLSGAVDIEGVGAQFLKSINGSHSAVLGLPLYELRVALENIK